MAKKSTGKKSFKSLFSKSEVNLTETVAELSNSSVSLDKKTTADKKKFKLPGLKIKSKSSGASEKTAPESVQVPSVETPTLNIRSSADNASTETDRSLLYATAPRSKGKELSTLEISPSSKPKRFATINLGLRKKKKKEENVLSKSTFGIDGAGIEVQPQAPSDISQMPLALNTTKTMSRSQAELDSCKKFDIPSPPPVAINKPEFVLPKQSETSVTIHSDPIKHQPIQNTINEMPKAPIATIPELKMGDNFQTVAKETMQSVSTYKEPVAAASSKVEKASSNFTMSKSDKGNDALVDSGNLQESNTKLQIPIGQPTQTKKQFEIPSPRDLQIVKTQKDVPKADTVAAVNSKTEVKSPAVNINTALDTNLTSERPAVYDNTKSAIMPIASNLQVSQNHDNVSSQSKMADHDVPKTGITIEDKQPIINNPFAIDPKVAVETPADYSKTKSTIEQIAPTLQVSQNDVNIPSTTTFLSQSKIADHEPPKMGITVEDKQPTIVIGSKIAVETPSMYSKTKSTMEPIASSLQASQDNFNIPSTTTILSQFKMTDQDEPKTDITIDNKQPINSILATGSNLNKQVDSSFIFSNTAHASKPAKLDTTMTETTTLYSSDKSAVAPVAVDLKDSQIINSISTTSFSSQSKVQDQEKLYGELYDSLFPENFTQEVISSLLNTPKMPSEYKTLETVTETVLISKFESERSSTPVSSSSPQKTEENVAALSSASANILNYVEKSPKDAPKAVYIRQVTTYDMTLSSDAKPVMEDGRFAYSEFSTDIKHDTGHLPDTMKPSTYAEKSPPLLNYAPSQETNAQVSVESKRKVVLVKELLSDEASGGSRDSGCPTPVIMEKISETPSSEIKIDEFEVMSVTSGPTDLHDGICSPAYLSVGSDDGSAMEIFYSAEEDNSDDLFTADATVIDTTRDRSILENANRTIVLREDANVSVNSEEKALDLDWQKPKQVESQSGSAVCEEREAAAQVMKDKNESKVELLVAPVERVKEFEVVPPFTEEIERQEKQGGSQVGLSDAPAVHLDKNPEKALTKDIHMSTTVLESSSHSSSRWQITPKFAEEAEQVISSANAKESMLADNVKEISDASRNNRAAVSVREADRVTEASGRSTPEQVAVATQGHSRYNTILQIREVKDAEGEPGPNPSQVDQSQRPDQDQAEQRSPPSSQTFALEQNLSSTAVDSDAESMSSGYSSLSTTLSLKTSSLSQSDDSKYRFRKVSLISENDQEAMDSDTVTSNGTDLDTDYKWRNRFEGVRQFRPLSNTYTTPEYSLRSTTTYSTDATATVSATPLPEVTDYSSISSTVEHQSRLIPALNDRLDDTDGGSRGRGLFEPGEGLLAIAAAPEPDLREGEAHGVTSQQGEEAADEFSGVFKATLVDLVPESPAPRHEAGDDDSPSQFDMDNLVDTLKNMGPSMRMRSLSARGAQPSLLTSSSLPPIVEDAPSSLGLLNNKKSEVDGLNGSIYSLPPDLGLKKNSFRDMRSPLELMKLSQQDQQVGSRPLRASATNSIVMRTSSDSSSPEDLPSPVLLNGSTGSRLDNSLIFSSLRSSSVDQTSENGIKSHRTLFRASSLPDIGFSNDRMSLPPKEGVEVDGVASRLERFSFLVNPTSSSSSGSLTGGEDYASRISRAPLPPLSIGSPIAGNSPTSMLSPTGSLELNRTFTPTLADSSPTRLLQRSFSGDSGVSLQQGPLVFNSVHNFQNHFQNQEPEPEPERNLLSKYRAFPDAYLTKEKEHGKLNPRPGKMYIFDRPGMCGQRTEIRSDVVDATSWELEETISIRVIRGGWVLYEKPDFKGEKIALDEGEIELTYPFGPPEEELQNGQMNGQTHQVQANGVQTNGEQDGEKSETPTEEKPARRFIIGSIRRAVRDYSVPEISLFPEQNAEGKKVVFRDSSEDARIFGFPIKANSIVINAGLWLVYAEPFFQGIPKVLEVGGYTNPEAWGVEKPYVGSLHPLKIGEPRVENINEPKMVLFEKPYYCGKSRTITKSTRDFMTRTDRQQQVFIHNVGSLKVMGGIWVGYEKEGFRGHQYLLEEGDYQDWRIWGGVDSELRSVRVIRADLSDPMMVMFEQPEEEQEEQEENTFEVTEAIPDVELFGFKTSTRSIQVFSGAWVAYSHVDYSGSQFILEKGFYSNYADWGSLDSRICSVQPILSVPRDTNSKSKSQITLYTDPEFQGQSQTIVRNQEMFSDKLLPKSCRVTGGSWVLYESKQFQGNMFVLSEGDYPNLSSMGCPASCFLRSAKPVPMTLSVPSISLFGLECLEGRQITTESEIFSFVEEGYNNHILSVRVNTGCWVLCEHSNYRGRQFLLEPIEITNWPKFSSLQTIGSMYPVRQKTSLFRVKNKELGHYLSVQGGVEEMKSGRVVVSAEVEPMSDVWYYQDGLIKSKLAPNMCLQVMGNVEPVAKVVLWSETRQPIQCWTAHMKGLISSLTFPGMVLDVKGGKTYDKDYAVIMPEDEERPCQQWEIEML